MAQLRHARSSEQLLWRRVWPPMALKKLHENYQPKRKLYSNFIPMISPWNHHEVPTQLQWNSRCLKDLKRNLQWPGCPSPAARCCWTWSNTPGRSLWTFFSPQFFLGNATRKRGNVWDSAHQINNPQAPSGELTVCYWKWQFIVDFPIKHGDFSLLC